MNTKRRPLADRLWPTERPVMTLTLAQQARKLQLAIDHIAAVIDDAPSDVIGGLHEALDLIHQAEGTIEDEREAARS